MDRFKDIAKNNPHGGRYISGKSGIQMKLWLGPIQHDITFIGGMQIVEDNTGFLQGRLMCRNLILRFSALKLIISSLELCRKSYFIMLFRGLAMFDIAHIIQLFHCHSDYGFVVPVPVTLLWIVMYHIIYNKLVI